FNLKSLGKQYYSIEGMITFIVAILTIAFGVYYYPKLKMIDFILIGAALVVFAALKRIKLFEKKLPRYFSRDIKGLGGEINLYTSIFVSVMIVLLIYIIY
ncbi:MAG: hypothetical protein R6U61_00645, partial [Thermoplasmata archaeon]